MSSDESNQTYRITMNGRVKDKIKRLHRLAVMIGARDRLVETLGAIEYALQQSPTTWGDPIKKLAGLHMTQYRRLYHQVVVYYAVHDDRPIVWLADIEPTRQSRLWIGEG